MTEEDPDKSEEQADQPATESQDNVQEPETDDENAAVESNEMETDAVDGGDDVKVASTPEFMEVDDTSKPVVNGSLDRFLDVQVMVAAEIGRVNIPLGELVGLGEGSVVELNRSVTSPVDLMAQGKRVATGEIVVVDDCFAIRIKSIDPVDANTV